MKISIWQQFSSNHSSDFRIVGTFPTFEQAERAAREIQSILRDVASFWRDLSPEEVQDWRGRLYGEITPIEQALSHVYGVRWSQRADTPHGLDWLPFDSDEAMKAVVLFEKSVFIENISDTHVGAEPFETLLKMWGASVVGYYEVGEGAIGVTLTCLAPDEATADLLLHDIRLTWQDKANQARDILIGGRFAAADHFDIRCEGLKLIYPIEFLNTIQEDFPAFIAYLWGHGCTQIEYMFEHIE